MLTIVKSDAPLYRKAWIACLSLAAVWIVTIITQTSLFQLSNRRFRKELEGRPELESEIVFSDRKGRKNKYYW